MHKLLDAVLKQLQKRTPTGSQGVPPRPVKPTQYRAYPDYSPPSFSPYGARRQPERGVYDQERDESYSGTTYKPPSDVE